jgi:integrase/recombinase XerD
MDNWGIYKKGFKAYLLLELSLAENTTEAYLSDVSKLASFLHLNGKVPAPSEITAEDLSAFLKWLHELGLGVRSQARLLSALKTFYKYLLLEGLSEQDPTQLVEAPRMGRKIPEVLTYEEIQRLFKAIDLSHPQGQRNRAILETLYACGLRVSELTELRLSNLFLDVGFIKVIGKGNKERIVPIGGEAQKQIKLYHEGQRRGQQNVKKGEEDFLFLNRRGRHLSRVMVFNIVKDAAQVAGLEKNISPHTFRHSFATHLIEGGADLKAVQDMLGHESIITTEIYTHLDTDYLRATVMQYHPRNRG